MRLAGSGMYRPRRHSGLPMLGEHIACKRRRLTVQNLENILVVVTREVDCTLVLEKAQILAAAANANTFVVRVIYDDVVDSGIPRAEDAQRLKTFIMEAEETYLEDLVKNCNAKFQNIELATVWNKRQWEGVKDVAEDIGADLIIKVANLEARSQEVIHTPDDWNLLRNAKCPVMLVKPQAWESVPAIVAAVDILDEAHQEMNTAILEEADSLAKALGGILHIVNAYPLFEPWVGELGAGYNYEKIKDDIESELQESILGIAKAGGIDFSMLQIREGKPSMVIRDVVDECSADLVVMGTVGRSGVAGLVIGNTSEAVLHVVNTDVVV
jgi:universal stress protein E